MKDQKTEIKRWLARTDQDRQWLASHCGVSKNTVNNWLSSSIAIPPRKLGLIEVLMEKDRLHDKRRHAPSAYVTLEMTLQEETRWQRAALAQAPPQTLKDWAYDVLNRAAAAHGSPHILPDTERNDAKKHA